MAENKTRETDASVDDYLSAIEDETRRKDCQALAKLMTKATKAKPKMWGTSIVGFGSYHYKYESGREGDSCLTGFSSRKGDISIYLVASFPGRERASREARKAQDGQGVPVHPQAERRGSQSPRATRRGRGRREEVHSWAC